MIGTDIARPATGTDLPTCGEDVAFQLFHQAWAAECGRASAPDFLAFGFKTFSGYSGRRDHRPSCTETCLLLGGLQTAVRFIWTARRATGRLATRIPGSWLRCVSSRAIADERAQTKERSCRSSLGYRLQAIERVKIPANGTVRRLWRVYERSQDQAFVLRESSYWRTNAFSMKLHSWKRKPSQLLPPSSSGTVTY